uniref:Uncharacterized protein n=1 Tax=Candidatus Methanomethylicus mesodigestus TaxID=1867258 RepID=A0A7C3IWX4_9CREN
MPEPSWDEIVDQKVMESLSKATGHASKASDILSLGGTPTDLYKPMLLCRLEVQYSLAALQLGKPAQPRVIPPRGKIELEAGMIKVAQGISDASRSIRAGEREEAARLLIAADAHLAKLIMHLRSPAGRGASGLSRRGGGKGSVE